MTGSGKCLYLIRNFLSQRADNNNMTGFTLKTGKILLFLLVILTSYPITTSASNIWFQIGSPYFRVGYSTSSYVPYSYRYSYPWYYNRTGSYGRVRYPILSHAKVARDTKSLENLLVAKKEIYDAIKKENALEKAPTITPKTDPQIKINPSPSLEMIPKETITTDSVVINYY